MDRSRLIGSGLVIFVLLLCGCASSKPGSSVARPTTNSGKFESEIVAFEKQDEKTPPPTKPILFVGSSTIRLWNVKDAFPNLPVLNRGFGGSQVEDVLYYFDRVVTRYRPSTIVFYSCDNDLAAKKTPQSVVNQVNQFLMLVKNDLPDTRVIVIGVKPSIARWKLIEQMRETNRGLEKLMKSYRHGEYVDVESGILGPDGKPRPELFRADGLHLNDKGYEILNERVGRVLKQ